MNSKLLLTPGCLAAASNAWAQDGSHGAVPDYLKAHSSAEFVSGTVPAANTALRVGDARWMMRSGKTMPTLEQHARAALEVAAVQLAAEADGVLVASTTWQSSYSRERAMVPELADAERAERCVEKGADVSRVVGGVVGLLALGIGQQQAANMIASGARAGNESLQWQRYDHLASADRVVCGRGEYVLETKVVVSGGSGQVLEFLVRSALPGGAMPAEAATVVGRNAEAVALELKALQSGACDRALRCGAAVATAPRSP